MFRRESTSLHTTFEREIMGVVSTLFWAIPKLIVFNLLSLITTLMGLVTFLLLTLLIFIFERRFLKNMLLVVAIAWPLSRNAIASQDDAAAFASTFINSVYTPLIAQPINLLLELVQIPLRVLNAWTLFWQTIWGKLFNEVGFDWWSWAASRELHMSTRQALKTAATLRMVDEALDRTIRDQGFRTLTADEVMLLKYKIDANIQVLDDMGAFTGGIEPGVDGRALEDTLLSGALIGEKILTAIISIVQDGLFFFLRIFLDLAGVILGRNADVHGRADLNQDWLEIVFLAIFEFVLDLIDPDECIRIWPQSMYACIRPDLWENAQDVPSDLVRATVNLVCSSFDGGANVLAPLDIASQCIGVDLLEISCTVIEFGINAIYIVLSTIIGVIGTVINAIGQLILFGLGPLNTLLNAVFEVFKCILDPASCVKDIVCGIFGCRMVQYRKHYLEHGVLPDHFPMDELASAGPMSPWAKHAAMFPGMTFGEARDFVSEKRRAHTELMERSPGALVPRDEHPDFWEETLESANGNSTGAFHMFSFQLKKIAAVCSPNTTVETIVVNGTQVNRTVESEFYYTCNETVLVMDAHGNNETLFIEVAYTNFTRRAEVVFEDCIGIMQSMNSNLNTAIGMRIVEKRREQDRKDRMAAARAKYGPEQNIIKHRTERSVIGGRASATKPGSAFYRAVGSTVTGDLVLNVWQRGIAATMDSLYNTTAFTNATKDTAYGLRRCDGACKTDIHKVSNGTGGLLKALMWTMHMALTPSGYRNLTRQGIEAKINETAGNVYPLAEAAVRWAGRIEGQGRSEEDVEVRASREVMRFRMMMERSKDAFSRGTRALRREMYELVDRGTYGNSTDAFIEGVFDELRSRMGPRTRSANDTAHVPVDTYDDALWRAGKLLQHTEKLNRDMLLKPGTRVSNRGGVNGRALAAAAGFSLVLVGTSVFSFGAAAAGAAASALGAVLLLLVQYVAPNVIAAVIIVPRFAVSSIVSGINGDEAVDRPDLILPWFFAIQASVTDWFNNGITGFDFSTLQTQLNNNLDASINLIGITFLRDLLTGGVLGQLFGIGSGGEPVFDPITGRVTDTPATYFNRWGQCDPTAPCAISDPISKCYGSIDPTDGDEWRDRLCTNDAPCFDGVSGVYGRRLCPGYQRTGFHLLAGTSTIVINPDCNNAFGYDFKAGLLVSFQDYVDEASTVWTNGIRSLKVLLRMAVRGERTSPLFLIGWLVRVIPFVGFVADTLVTLTVVSNVSGYLLPDLAEAVIGQLEEAETVEAYQPIAEEMLSFLRSPNYATPGLEPFGKPIAAERLCAAYAFPQAGVLLILAAIVLPILFALAFTGLPISIIYTVLFNVVFIFDIILGVLASWIRSRAEKNRLNKIRKNNEKVKHTEDAVEQVVQINNDMLALTPAINAGSTVAMQQYNNLDLLRRRALQLSVNGRRLRAQPTRRSTISRAISAANRRYADNVRNIRLTYT